MSVTLIPNVHLDQREDVEDVMAGRTIIDADPRGWSGIALSEWELNAAQVNTDPIRKEFERRLRGEWTEPVRAAGVRYETQLEVGRAAEALLDAARRNEAALIVIGMTARGTLGELVFSSVSHHLFHHAVRPVVTVPAGWEPEATDGTGPAR